jgi:hypothetical protein
MFFTKRFPMSSCQAVGLPTVVAGLALCLGCGDGRCTTSGEVTFDGQPIQEGTISLEPADGNGPATGGKIIAGKYELARDAAPLPGKKIVRISAVRKTGRKIPGDSLSAPGTIVDEIKRYVPDVYNTRSTLSCEVAAGSPNHFDFRLRSP